MRSMKILITGAHFTPAVAVIKELKKISPDLELVYVGRNRTLEGDEAQSLESQIIPKMGVQFISLVAGRLQKNFGINFLIGLVKIPIGFGHGFWIIANERPSVVASFGGYVAVPIVFWSWLFSIPIITHEQTLVWGFANSFSNIFADKIAVSFEQLRKSSNDKIVVTGNPIREEVLTPVARKDSEVQRFIAKAKDGGRHLLYITGGNQGSHAINKTIMEAYDKLLEKFFVIHQTGDSKYRDFEKLQEKAVGAKNGERYLACKWIDGQDVGKVMENADISLSRGGANTLLELCYWRVPTLVVPLPESRKSEQLKNAQLYAKSNLVRILLQTNLNSDRLFRELVDFYQDSRKGLKIDEELLKNTIIPDAAKRLALEILLMSEKKQSAHV